MTAIPVCGVLSDSLRSQRTRPLSCANPGALRACAPIAAIAIALGGCSIPLESLSKSAPPQEEGTQQAATASIVSLAQAIRKNPDDPINYNKRGLALAQAGKNEEALADFNKAISLDPNYGQAFANRGTLYRKSRRFEEALADYERALTLDATYAPAWAGRGLIYKARNQTGEALEDFNKAIDADPPDRIQIQTVGKLPTAAWSEGDKTYLLATKGDEQFLRSLIPPP